MHATRMCDSTGREMQSAGNDQTLDDADVLGAELRPAE
jgi:hypothetical protein